MHDQLGQAVGNLKPYQKPSVKNGYGNDKENDGRKFNGIVKHADGELSGPLIVMAKKIILDRINRIYMISVTTPIEDPALRG